MIVPVDHALRNHGCILLKDTVFYLSLSLSLFQPVVRFSLVTLTVKLQSQHVSHGKESDSCPFHSRYLPPVHIQYYMPVVNAGCFLPSSSP